MLSGLIASLALLVSATLELLRCFRCADALVRSAAHRLPRARHLLLSQLAFRWSKRGQTSSAVELLLEIGPPKTDVGFYYAEIGQLQEDMGNTIQAKECYLTALEYRSSLSEEFIHWLNDRVRHLSR